MFDGRRVLVAEDDILIAMLLEDMLRELGFSVIGPAHTLDQAFALVDANQNAAVDAAILDVNLGGASVFPLADSLRRRGAPIIFATGYGEDSLREADAGAPVLVKPYHAQQLASALSALLATERLTS